MKIKLLKPLEMNGVTHPEGTEVDVDKSTYDWLMQQYIAERQAIRAQVEEFEKKIGVKK